MRGGDEGRDRGGEEMRKGIGDWGKGRGGDEGGGRGGEGWPGSPPRRLRSPPTPLRTIARLTIMR